VRRTVLIVTCLAALPGKGHADPAPPFTLAGYVEAYYQWNFRDPSNRITNLRAFDDRHDAMTLSNVVLDAQADREDVVTRVALQVGSTPTGYYATEPALPGSGYASATSGEVWKYVQQAYAGYRFHAHGELLVTAGLFLSPIGPESIALKDQWTWSHSNLFAVLPAYHAGLRAAYTASPRWTLTGAILNGWNAVVDGNAGKSLLAQAVYTDDALSATVQYLGGPERPEGSPSGHPWRHLVDGYATWKATANLALQGHLDAGFERGDPGTSSWLMAAGYAKLALSPTVAVVTRVDATHEWRPPTALPIFVTPRWLASATATVDYHPASHVAFRLELRHDAAERDAYFGGTVVGDGVVTPYVPNRSAQDTITAGVTSWF
jgi:hypothetical protein